MKRWLFWLVAMGVAGAGVEGGSWLLLHLTAAPELEPRLHALAVSADREEARGGSARTGHTTIAGGFFEEVIHPYLGFVTVPPAAPGSQPLSLESLGFPGGGPMVRERRPDTVVMGVFGGSVAENFARSGGPQRVFSALQSLPEFGGKRLVLLNASHVSYKQPQALMTLAYLLSLGVKLDLVILLDGFNDVAGAAAEYQKTGLFPLFPSRWAQRVANLDTATGLRSLIGEIAYRKQQRARWADWLAHSRLRYSPTAALVFSLYDRSVEEALAAGRAELAYGRSEQPLDYLATGPRYDAAGLYADLVYAWAEGSISMNALAREDGFRFFHFLQPNQHVPRSKPMSPEEVAVAIRGGDVFAPHVEKGYPLLREKGEELRRRGVAFHDLTLLFADIREPLYVDNCCHVGKRGNELMADAIAAAIRDDLDRSPPRPAPPTSPPAPAR